MLKVDIDIDIDTNVNINVNIKRTPCPILKQTLDAPCQWLVREEAIVVELHKPTELCRKTAA